MILTLTQLGSLFGLLRGILDRNYSSGPQAKREKNIQLLSILGPKGKRGQPTLLEFYKICSMKFDFS